MPKEFDIEDENFEALLADKRHREVSGTLKSIAAHLSKDNDKEVVNAINGQADKIGDLVKAIQNMPKPDAPKMPDVKIEYNPQEFVTSVQKICEDIVASNNKVIEALENRLLPDSFELVKNYGITQSVKVNYKSAKQINLLKTKYQA